MDLSTKNIFKFLSITTLFIFLIFMVVKIGWVFTWIIAAFLISSILTPVANFFQKFMPWKNRGLAVLATFLTVVGLFSLFLLVVLPPIIKEISSLGEQLNQWITSPSGSQKIERVVSLLESQKSQINTSNIYSVLRQASSTLAAGLGSTVSAISGSIFAFITILTLSFFMLMDTEGLVAGISYFVPRKYKNLVKKLHDELFVLISKYFAGVLFVAIIAGLFAFIPLLILGVPYSAVLALVVGVMSLVPMIGATLGGGAVILVCLVSGNYFAAVIMTIYFVIYQQLENNLVIPLVQKRTVKMPPLGIIISLLVGGAIAGALGTILAIPAAAFIKVTFDIIKNGELPKAESD